MSLVIDNLHKRFARSRRSSGSHSLSSPGRSSATWARTARAKTTTTRIVLGILRADSGAATSKGSLTSSLPRRTWGYIPEERGLYPRMTVVEQLLLFADL